jgi:beta-phosphoglucomutase-like phosphatase (HAD superfamily)
MTSFLAACFDLDGTLIDTESIHMRAESECLATFGIDIEDSRRPRTFGLGIESGMQLLADVFELNFSSVLNTYLPLWESLQISLRMLPGANEVLSWLVNHKIPLALVTSGDTAYVDVVDSVVGLKQAFSITITSDSIQRLKPDPMAYHEAAKKLGVDPDVCIGFEDSGAGITALNSAGMFSVAVHPDHESRPELQTARLRVKNMDAIQPRLVSWFE